MAKKYTAPGVLANWMERGLNYSGVKENKGYYLSAPNEDHSNYLVCGLGGAAIGKVEDPAKAFDEFQAKLNKINIEGREACVSVMSGMLNVPYTLAWNIDSLHRDGKPIKEIAVMIRNQELPLAY